MDDHLPELELTGSLENALAAIRIGKLPYDALDPSKPGFDQVLDAALTHGKSIGTFFVDAFLAVGSIRGVTRAHMAEAMQRHGLTPFTPAREMNLSGIGWDYVAKTGIDSRLAEFNDQVASGMTLGGLVDVGDKTTALQIGIDGKRELRALRKPRETRDPVAPHTLFAVLYQDGAFSLVKPGEKNMNVFVEGPLKDYLRSLLVPVQINPADGELRNAGAYFYGTVFIVGTDNHTFSDPTVRQYKQVVPAPTELTGCIVGVLGPNQKTGFTIGTSLQTNAGVVTLEHYLKNVPVSQRLSLKKMGKKPGTDEPVASTLHTWIGVVFPPGPVIDMYETKLEAVVDGRLLTGSDKSAIGKRSLFEVKGREVIKGPIDEMNQGRPETERYSLYLHRVE